MCSGERSSSANGRDRPAALVRLLVVDLEQQGLVATGRSGVRRSSGGPHEEPPRLGRWPVRPPARPDAARGRPRRWRARSTGPSSSGATGWGRCRRRRGRSEAPSRPRAGWRRGRTTRLASPISASPTSSSATEAARLATCMWRSSGSWSEIIGVTGCSASRSLSELTTSATSSTSEASNTGPQLGLEGPHGLDVLRDHGAVQPRAVGEVLAQRLLVGEVGVDERRCALGVPDEVHRPSLRRSPRGRSGVSAWSGAAHTGDAVHGELPDVVGAVVVRRQPAAVEAARVDDPLAVRAVAVDVADDARCCPPRSPPAARPGRPTGSSSPRRSRAVRTRRGRRRGWPSPPPGPAPPAAPRRRRPGGGRGGRGPAAGRGGSRGPCRRRPRRPGRPPARGAGAAGRRGGRWRSRRSGRAGEGRGCAPAGRAPARRARPRRRRAGTPRRARPARCRRCGRRPRRGTPGAGGPASARPT